MSENTGHTDHLSAVRRRAVRQRRPGAEEALRAGRLLVATLRELTGLHFEVYGNHGLYVGFEEARRWLREQPAGRVPDEVRELLAAGDGVTEGVTE